MRIDRKQAFVQRRGFGSCFNHADEQSARAPRRKSAAAQPGDGTTIRIAAVIPTRSCCIVRVNGTHRTERTTRARPRREGGAVPR
jgi:hypothetical protein